MYGTLLNVKQGCHASVLPCMIVYLLLWRSMIQFSHVLRYFSYCGATMDHVKHVLLHTVTVTKRGRVPNVLPVGSPMFYGIPLTLRHRSLCNPGFMVYLLL